VQETPDKFHVDGVGEYQQPRCPRCQSLDVAFDELNKRVAYGGMLFANLPIKVTSDHWKCHACGHEWEDDGGAASAKRTKEPE
jgi:transposase-like protein